MDRVAGSKSTVSLDGGVIVPDERPLPSGRVYAQNDCRQTSAVIVVTPRQAERWWYVVYPCSWESP